MMPGGWEGESERRALLSSGQSCRRRTEELGWEDRGALGASGGKDRHYETGGQVSELGPPVGVCNCCGRPAPARWR